MLEASKILTIALQFIKAPFCKQYCYKCIMVFLGLLLSIMVYSTYIKTYIFEYKMQKYSSEFLKKIIRDDVVFVNGNSNTPTQFFMDINNMAVELFDDYENDVSVLSVTYNECPTTPLRVSGIYEQDKGLIDTIKGDKMATYESLKRRKEILLTALRQGRKIKLFTIYHNNKCVNNSYFESLVSDYYTQIIPIYKDFTYHKSEKAFGLEKGKYIIFRYNDYLYMFYEIGGVQSQDIARVNGTRNGNLLYKKLHITEIKNYLNGALYNFLALYKSTDK